MTTLAIEDKLLASSGLMDEPHFRRLLKFQTRRREALVGSELEIRTRFRHVLVSKDNTSAWVTVYYIHIHRKFDTRGNNARWVLKKRYSELKAYRRLLFKQIEHWEYTVRREFTRNKAAHKQQIFAVVSTALRRAISPSFPRKRFHSDKPAVLKERAIGLSNFVRKLLGVYTDLAVYKTNSQLQTGGFASSWAQLCTIFSELGTILRIPQPQKDAEIQRTAAVLALNDFTELGSEDACEELCSICLNEDGITDEARPIVALPCGHHFHEDCVIDWFSTSPTCPLCRQCSDKSGLNRHAEESARRGPKRCLWNHEQKALVAPSTPKTTSLAALPRIMPSSSLPVSLLPSMAVLPSPYARAPMSTSVELPKLRIPIEAARQQQQIDHSYDNTYRRGSAVGYHSTPPVPVKTEASNATMQSPYGPSTCSPSSPSSFFTQPEMAKLGLTPLLEAAEQIRPSTAETLPPLYGHSSPLKRELSLTQTLPSIVHAMGGYPLDTLSVPKRARHLSDVDMDMQASNSLLGHMPRQAMIYPSVPQQLPKQRPCHQSTEQHIASYVPMAEVQNISMAGLKSPSAHGLSAYSGASVWEIVLNTGKFPTDICLSENSTSSGVSPIAPFDLHEIQSGSEDVIDAKMSSEVKQVDEEEHTTALIQAVKKGEEGELPLDMSAQKPFVANNLQCKTMRVSKKLPSLGMSPRGPIGQEDEPVCPRDKSFNPLSLKSIMNNESSASPSSDVYDVAETIANSSLIRQSPSGKSVGETKKSTQRVLKRSDYSQHGMVRSGRWSVEEENYAKAMIEAFKAGYLPLHGNVSLRKFLSEVLVCHPMRISKKFVGYVHKYHWYRIAAGKCDPEAKRQVFYRLTYLERVFWTSLQQNSERPSSLRRDD